jgi:menaquinol-cytochrome c reductase cytochrome b/c subunit
VRRAIAGIALAALVASGCGSEGESVDDRIKDAAADGAPTEIERRGAPGTDAGRDLVASSGCLGCHRIGSNGNQGPGPDLTTVGGRLPARAIADVLVDPDAPMPSYAGLPGAQRREIVRYLSSLR